LTKKGEKMQKVFHWEAIFRMREGVGGEKSGFGTGSRLSQALMRLLIRGKEFGYGGGACP